MKKSISAILWGILIMIISFLSQVAVVAIYSFFAIFSMGWKAGMEGTASFEPSALDIQSMITTQMSWLIPLSGVISLLIFWIYTKARKQKFKEEFRLHPFSLRGFISVFFVGIAFSSLVEILLQLTGLPEILKDSQEMVDSLVTGGNIFLTLLGVGILVPIIEELTFRGILLRIFEKGFPVYVAVLLQAICFALFHGNLLQGSYTLILGLIAGCLVVWYKSIWPAVMLHVGFNSVNVLAAHFIEQNELATGFVYLISILIGFGITLYGLVKIRPWRNLKDVAPLEE